MANSTSNTGLKPLRMRSGARYSGQFNLYYAPSTYGTDLLVGDAVVRSGTANAARVTCANEAWDIGQLPTITKATNGATNPITGAIVGFKPLVDQLTLLYGKASTDRVVMVADDPNIVFGIRDYGSATAIGITAIGLNAVLKAGSDNTDKSCSGVRLDDGTTTAPAADATFQLRIVGAGDSDTKLVNDPTDKAALWEVMINLHTENQGRVGL